MFIGKLSRHTDALLLQRTEMKCQDGGKTDNVLNITSNLVYEIIQRWSSHRFPIIQFTPDLEKKH